MSGAIGSNRLPELAARINAEHEAAAGAIKRGLGHAMTAGDLLTEAKATVPHGQWAAWLTSNTALSERTAQRYMQLARERSALESKTATVADLTIRGACELIAKPPEKPSEVVKAWRLVPEDGHSLVAYVGTVAGWDFVIITPSIYPDYYYVTHVSGQEDEYGLPKDSTITCLAKPARWQSLPEVLFVVAGIDTAAAEWWQHPFSARRDRNPFDIDDTADDCERRDSCLAFADALGVQLRRDLPFEPWPKNRKEFRQARRHKGPWA